MQFDRQSNGGSSLVIHYTSVVRLRISDTRQGYLHHSAWTNSIVTVRYLAIRSHFFCKTSVTISLADPRSPFCFFLQKQAYWCQYFSFRINGNKLTWHLLHYLNGMPQQVQLAWSQDRLTCLFSLNVWLWPASMLYLEPSLFLIILIAFSVLSVYRLLGR